ncbi:MAG: hypothetical protein OEV42_10280 [Deltaproteobacteria bacterium]|nr:hypothetical protein [Deltaproteobacteria bacterium]
MQKRLSIVALLIVCMTVAGPAYSINPISGIIVKDTVWTLEGSPYTVVGSIQVAPGITLTIDGGVEVKFMGVLVQTHQTHFDAAGKGPGITGCSTCHNYSKFADGLPFETTTVCDQCHSPEGAYNGVDSTGLSQGAKDNWREGGVYNADNTLKPGKEMWCLGCHDDDPGTTEINESSYIQGIFAPNIAGGFYNGNSYGYFDKGHGKSLGNCLDCHDAGKRHIDGNARTYEVDESSSPPYVTVNPWGDSYRLKSTSTEHTKDFCLDCHNGNEVLGTSLEDKSHTNLWDINADIQPPRNAHRQHLSMNFVTADGDWDGVKGADGKVIPDSKMSCVTCHNPHGSPTGPMIRHGELISAPGTVDKVPALNFSYIAGNPPLRDPDATLAESSGASIDPAGQGLTKNNVCNTCHIYKDYTRTPFLGPKVILSNIESATVLNDGAGSTVITVYVVDPDNDHNSISVEIDLTPIGGNSNQAMTYNGDKSYSYEVNIPAGSSDTSRAFEVTAWDIDGNMSTNSVTIFVAVPGSLYLNDPEAVYVDSWPSVEGISNAHGGDEHYRTAGDGSATATWTPVVPQTGLYNVYARWPAHINRADNAPFKIQYDGGSAVVRVNQEINDNQWVLLETCHFTAGTSGYVQLSNDANGYVIADAIKLEPVP